MAIEAEIDPDPERRAWKNEHGQKIHPNLVDIFKQSVAGALRIASSNFRSKVAGRFNNGTRTYIPVIHFGNSYTGC
jgi:hypothetical protein